MVDLSFVARQEMLRESFIAMLLELRKELRTHRLMDRHAFANLVRLATAFGIADESWKTEPPYRRALRKTIVRNWKDLHKPHYPDHLSAQINIIQFIYCTLTGSSREEFQKRTEQVSAQ